MVKRNVDTEALYKEVAALMVEQRQCVALTGAGVSEESGIPTFRSKGGLWEKYDPIEFASIYFIMEKAGTALPRIVAEVNKFRRLN